MKKMIVDILLLILMLIEYSKTYLPSEIHEIIGILLIVLVAIHLALNKKYLKTSKRESIIQDERPC
jgi:cytochrome b